MKITTVPSVPCLVRYRGTFVSAGFRRPRKPEDASAPSVKRGSKNTFADEKLGLVFLQFWTREGEGGSRACSRFCLVVGASEHVCAHMCRNVSVCVLGRRAE